MVNADAIRPSGQVEPPLRLDRGADREDEQRVAARVGDVAPRPRGRAVDAGDVRGADARRSTADDPPARVAQLDDPVAPEQHHAPSPGQRGDVAVGPGGRRQPRDAGRAAPGEQHRRGDRQAHRSTRGDRA
jgi:hypothetical protein